MKRYGEGVEFDLFNHLPECDAHIDSTFTVRAVNFCAQGRIYYDTAAGDRRILPAPVFWWTWPERRFVYGALEGESWDHYYATYSGPRGAYLAATTVLPESDEPFLLLQSGRECQKLFEELLDHLSTESYGWAANTLDRLCLSASDASVAEPAEDPRRAAIDAVVSEIQSRPDQEWSTEHIADRMGVSAGHLRRLFNQYVGVPVRRFVIDTRLRTAAELLRTGNQPVKAIADAVGIPDVVYFNKMFRSRYSDPPARYRDRSQLVNR